MATLKPIDHQNIVLRLLARSAACDAQHLTTLSMAYKLPVSLHQVRVACDELVAQQFVARTIQGYRLTTWGECELPAVPLLDSYCVAPRQRPEPELGESIWRAGEKAGEKFPGSAWGAS